MGREMDPLHLLVLDDHGLGIRSLVDLGAHAKPFLRCRPADQVDHRGQTDQRLASPVHGDIGEQAMLDAVPLARARRIVADRDRQARAIGKALQFPFPQPQSRTVAAPRIGRDPQAGSPP